MRKLPTVVFAFMLVFAVGTTGCDPLSEEGVLSQPGTVDGETIGRMNQQPGVLQPRCLDPHMCVKWTPPTQKTQRIKATAGGTIKLPGVTFTAQDDKYTINEVTARVQTGEWPVNCTQAWQGLPFFYTLNRSAPPFTLVNTSFEGCYIASNTQSEAWVNRSMSEALPRGVHQTYLSEVRIAALPADYVGKEFVISTNFRYCPDSLAPCYPDGNGPSLSTDFGNRSPETRVIIE